MATRKYCLVMVLVSVCVAVLVDEALAVGTVKAPEDKYSWASCEMEKRCAVIKHERLDGRITNREYILQMAEVLYGGDGPVLLKNCNKHVQVELIKIVTERTFAYRPELTEEDKAYLRTLSDDFIEPLERLTAAEQERKEGPPPPAPPSMCDRVNAALKERRITRKEAVITKLTYYFAPQRIPPDSEFSPRPGETGCIEYSVSGEIERQFDSIREDLTEDDESFLRSISPHIEACMNGWESSESSVQGNQETNKTSATPPDTAGLGLHQEHSETHATVPYTDKKRDANGQAEISWHPR